MKDPVSDIDQLLKTVFKSADLELHENTMDVVGDFLVKDNSGYSQHIDSRLIDLDSKDRKVIIPKSDWNYELPENLWLVLVLFMEGIEPHLYLIPSDVFHQPDNYIFFDNDQGERFKHLSNWEIRIFPEGIKKLSEYAFATSVKEFL